MLACVESSEAEDLSKAMFFANQAAIGFYEWQGWSAEKGLEPLVFRTSRKSSCLEAHLERIHYCYRHNLSAQLYGALLDFLIVLERKGEALANRMVAGAKQRLDDGQHSALKGYLADKLMDINTLPHTPYSVFAKGLAASSAVVEKRETASPVEYDPIQLARDYVEYSQVDEAMHILEKALLDNPERLELHQELLALYQSTGDIARLKQFSVAYSDKYQDLPPQWQEYL